MYLLTPTRDITYLDMKNICNDIGEYFKNTDDTFDKCYLEYHHPIKHFIGIEFKSTERRKDYKGLRVSCFQYPIEKQNFIYNCFKVDDNRKINNDDEDIILGVQKTTKKSYGLCLKTYEYNEFPFSKEDMKAIIQIFKEYDLILKKSNAYKSTVRIYDYLKKGIFS